MITVLASFSVRQVASVVVNPTARQNFTTDLSCGRAGVDALLEPRSVTPRGPESSIQVQTRLLPTPRTTETSCLARHPDFPEYVDCVMSLIDQE